MIGRIRSNKVQMVYLVETRVKKKIVTVLLTDISKAGSEVIIIWKLIMGEFGYSGRIIEE